MRRIAMGVLGLLVIVPALGALDDKEKAKPEQLGTPAEQVKALTAEYNKARNDFIKEYRAAADDEERQKMLSKQPQPQAYAGRFLAIVEKHPKDPAAFDALYWIVMNVRDAHADKALDRLVKDFITSPKLGMLCPMIARSRSSDADKQLRVILEKSPHRDVQGQACYSLAQVFKARVADEGFAQAEKDQAFKEAEQYLNTTIEKFGDVQIGRGSLAEIAKKQLVGLKNLLNLQVGKVAPEIEGEDIDGKAFKLTDYRGKVVVLDFWGHW